MDTHIHSLQPNPGLQTVGTATAATQSVKKKRQEGQV